LKAKKCTRTGTSIRNAERNNDDNNNEKAHKNVIHLLLQIFILHCKECIEGEDRIITTMFN